VARLAGALLPVRRFVRPAAGRIVAMSRFGYQAIGFAVWNGAKWYVRRRYGDVPRKLALGSLLVAALAALLVAGKRAAGD
jgi:hypothetical protein